MKLQVVARALPGLQGKLAARTNRQRAAARQVTQESAERTLVRVQELVPRDTHYMADHTRLEITHQGLGYQIGWKHSDFVGQVNPATGTEITAFYPVYVVYGTRYMAGRDPLTPALEAEKPEYRRRIRDALSRG